jgi:predicted acetyltransferase
LDGGGVAMEVVDVDAGNFDIYLNLVQAYEAEFSPLTGKKPGSDGRFALDTHLGGNVHGHLLYLGETPAGLAAIESDRDEHEVREFYVVPLFRGRLTGSRFAQSLWRRFPGNWEIKQIAGASNATAFWRRAVGEFTQGRFEEDHHDDPVWGHVVRQRFVVGA